MKEWAAELRKGGLAPATVKRRVYLLSASLNAAIDAEILKTNVAYRIELPGGETDVRRYLEKDEEIALLGKFDGPVDRAMSRLLFGTGLRYGEAVGLQKKRVDLKGMSIRVAEVWDRESASLKAYPKGRRIRSVPFEDDLLPFLEERIAAKGDRLFPLDYWNWRRRHWAPAVALVMALSAKACASRELLRPPLAMKALTAPQ